MMNEKELYDLAISDVPKYSLLNEILAIRDNRFPDEEVDYCINVNGCISLDVLNKYVDLIKTEDEIRLDQTMKVFEALSFIINHGTCSYRYLIYDMLGFKYENYSDLIKGLDITNAVVELQELREIKEKIKKIIEGDD